MHLSRYRHHCTELQSSRAKDFWLHTLKDSDLRHIFSDLFRIAEQTQRDAGVRHFMGADYFQKKEKGIQGEEQRYQAVIAILDILNNSETEEEIVKKINVL